MHHNAFGSILFIFSLIRFGPEKCGLGADSFVGICRVLSVLSDKHRLYNQAMKITEPYIPKEYLALKINYLRQQLAAMPEVTKTKRVIRGKKLDVYIVNSRLYRSDSITGKELQLSFIKRDQLERELTKLESTWNCYFIGMVPQDIEPRKITRRLYRSVDDAVILNSDFFESLKHDADPNYRETKTVFYNGTYYRSAAEADIARFYTENGIPFKYEPEIWLNGLKYPVYSDFVILIKELDLCKFHEHFGMKNSANYNRITATKYNNYSGAGLLPELDVFYTYDVDGVPFDLRTLSTKLNSVIYDSLFIP